MPTVLNVMQLLKSEIGQTTALYGLICGPLKLASHLRWMNLFIDMYEDEVFVKKRLSFCTDLFLKISDYYIGAGMDIIAAVDPVVSQISPEIFTQYLSEHFIKIFNHIRYENRYSSLFVCGYATRNIEVMCNTGPDCISVDENIDIVNAKEITDSYDIIISINYRRQ